MHEGLPECMYVYRMYVHHMYVRNPWISKEGIRYDGTGVAESCELLCGFWESNLDLLEAQLVILTTEPSLQPLAYSFSKTFTKFLLEHCWFF